jgi:putative hemolysin
MPNPASVFCEEHGGKLEIRTAVDGSQSGACVFPDGSECDEWAYYRGECQPGDSLLPPSGTADMPNPASVFCEEHDGKLEVRTAVDGSQSGICKFPDGSECDEWAYYRSECQPGSGEVPPEPVAVPGYVNEAYGFSFDPASIWAIEEFADYLLFSQTGYQVFVGYQWANEEPKPFRTGMPSGEFVEGGSAILLGQPIPKHILVWEGKNKVVDYGGRIKVGDLILVMYLDAIQLEGAVYGNFDLPEDVIAQADQLIATFDLVSGETPVLEFNP